MDSGCLVNLLMRCRRQVFAFRTSIYWRSLPVRDRSPAFESALRRFRESRWRTAKRVVPVSVLEALARSAANRRSSIGAWMDAQRQEVFAALYSADGADVLIQPVSAAPATVLRTWSQTVDMQARHVHRRRRHPSSRRSSRANRRCRRSRDAAARLPASSGKLLPRTRDERCCRMRSCRSTCGGPMPSWRATGEPHAMTAGTARPEYSITRLQPRGGSGRSRRARSGIVHQSLVARDAPTGPSQHRCRPACTCCATRPRAD